MVRKIQRNMKAPVRQRGAYVLQLELSGQARLNVGALGEHELKPGRYLYVGSARRGMGARVARHKRLAETKAGIAHWHIDYLLLHPRCRLARVELLPGAEECTVSRSIGGRNGVAVPVPGFGSTDCRSGCRAHLFFESLRHSNLGRPGKA
jgi:Uri superfamily endonuclease